MTCTLSNGDQVTIKPFATRKVFKEIQKVQFANTEFVQDDKGKIRPPKFDIVGSNEAGDFAVLSMIDFIQQGEARIQPTAEYVDNLPVNDFDMLKKEIDAVLYPVKPEEAKKA